MFQPLLLWKIIHYFESCDPEDQRALVMAYVSALALSLSSFGLAVLQHVYYYIAQRMGMKIRVAVCHMIYRKVRLSQIFCSSEWVPLLTWSISLCRLWLSAVRPWSSPPQDRLSTS